MKHVSFLAFAAMSLLAACAMNQKTVAADDRASCIANHPSVKGDFVAQAKCMTAAEANDTKPGNPDADLVSKMETERLALANSADAGIITPDQYEQDLHKLEAQINTAEQARHNNIPAL